MRIRNWLCFILAGMLFLMPLCIFRTSVEAASSGEIREQINQMQQENEKLEELMEQLESQLSENLSDIQTTVKQKSNIDQQISILQSKILLTEEQLSAFNVLIADKQEEVDQAQSAFQLLHDTYKDRIRSMEEAGRLSYWAVLFQSKTFSDFLDRMNIIDEIARSDAKRLRELDAAAKKVIRLKEELSAGKDELVQTAREQELSRQLLQEKREEADKLLRDLLAKGAEYEFLLQESEDLQEQLMLDIALMEIEYDRAAYSEWLATYVPPTTTAPPTTRPTAPPTTAPTTEPTTSTNPNETPTEPTAPPKDASWITPVPWYVLTSPFGSRFHPILNIWRMHNGVDLACSEGTEIYASRGGVVTVASYQEGGAGNYVQIDHGDGYKSIYMHMTHYIVSPGQYVGAGQCIGYVGSTGLSDGNHLHFGISYNGTYVNPMEYIS